MDIDKSILPYHLEVEDRDGTIKRLHDLEAKIQAFHNGMKVGQWNEGGSLGQYGYRSLTVLYRTHLFRSERVVGQHRGGQRTGEG